MAKWLIRSTFFNESLWRLHKKIAAKILWLVKLTFVTDSNNTLQMTYSRGWNQMFFRFSEIIKSYERRNMASYEWNNFSYHNFACLYEFFQFMASFFDERKLFGKLFSLNYLGSHLVEETWHYFYIIKSTLSQRMAFSVNKIWIFLYSNENKSCT